MWRDRSKRGQTMQLLRAFIILAVLIAIIAPALAQDNPTPPKPQSDPKALEILKKVCDVYVTLTSMSYDAELTTYTEGKDGAKKDELSAKAAIVLAKPNHLRIEVTSDTPELCALLVADGTQVWEYGKVGDFYSSVPQPENATDIRGTMGGIGLFGQQAAFTKDPYTKMTEGDTYYVLDKPERIGDIECQVIRRVSPRGWSTATYVNPAKNVVVQTRTEYAIADGRTVQLLKRTKIAVDPSLSPDIFKFVAPKGSKEAPKPPKIDDESPG
jgi:outer membrane lipoprotein-sorting protein